MYVKSTGFFSLFMRGFTDIQERIIKQSVIHQEENERIKNDMNLQLWMRRFEVVLGWRLTFWPRQ
jgi:hypothetical protein